MKIVWEDLNVLCRSEIFIMMMHLTGNLLSPVYTTENCWHGSGETGMGAKKEHSNFVYTTPFLSHQKYRAKMLGPT